MSSATSPVPYEFNSDYLNALRQGDPAVETHFAEHFNPILLRTLRRKVRCADQARDIRQETFLRVLSTIRGGCGVRKPERFEVFVMGICNNIVRETYRRQRRSVAFSSLKDEPVADFPSAYALVLAGEIRGKVRRMLSQMHFNEKSVLEAVFFSEQTRDEICGKMGVSRDHLRVLLHRAKKRLRVPPGMEVRRAARRNRFAKALAS